jgi:hypothetical protein
MDTLNKPKSRFYAGVVTLDNNFANITGGAGWNRYFTAGAVLIQESDGWQTFRGTITGVGDLHQNFRAGTAYVRPVFIVNYQGGDGICQVDFADFKDITVTANLETRMNNVELVVGDESIRTSVMQSQSFLDLMETKANANDLVENYTTTEELNKAKDDLTAEIGNQISAIDFSPYATKTEMEQTATDISYKFSSSGGVNLLRNSVGFSGTDFWEVEMDLDQYENVLGYIHTIQNAELTEIGSGSAIILNGAKLKQVFSTTSQFYTFSTQVKKGTAGYGYIKLSYDDKEDIIEFLDGTPSVYQSVQMTIEPIGNQVTVELYGDVNGEILFTNTMANIGNTALQWQHSAGELYNTNVLMDLNGIRVVATTYEGYTAITPEEFAGYALVEGQMEKVFTLNKDVTEMSKAKVEKEMSLTPIKLIPIQSTLYNGWAFIAEI